MEILRGKRVVVFGCGYLGGTVARSAAALGARVVAVTKNPQTAELLRVDGIEVIVADLATNSWHDAVAGEVDCILNSVGSGGGGIESYRRSYVGGMASIVAWARRAGPIGTAVYTSSTSVYPQSGGVVVDEGASTGGGEERAQVLLEAESIFRGGLGAWHRGFVLRLAGIYGPGRHSLLDQVRSGEVAGTGDHRMNLVHRDDAAAAILACWSAPPEVAGDVFNVADDEPHRRIEVVTWLAAGMGVPVPRFSGAARSPFRGNAPDRLIANAKLKARFGWRPRFPTFREGYGGFLSH
jgi:nucleoside-diphosphate-sugar epimerase